nr:AIR synthase-related protein [uncultured Anaerobutyricum sp.]
MRIGKVKESILKRSVLRQLHNHSEQGSPASGEDAGVLFMPEFMPEFTQEFSEKNGVAMAVNPVEGWTFAAKRAVYGAVNSMLAAGAAPKAISLSILMPEEAEEKQLKALMKEIDSLCMQENILVLSGHTAVSPYVSTLILSVTAMGSITENRKDLTANKENNTANKGSIANSKGNTKQIAVVNAELDLVVAGTVGREGAAMLAAEYAKRLEERYAPSYIEAAKHLFDDGSMTAVADILQEKEVVSVHDVREGGIFAALWEMAAAANVGLSIDLKNIPIKQHTIEVCEYFNLNPYMLRSGGTLLLACANGARIVEQLKNTGVEAAVIGQTTAGNDRLIRYDDEARFLEPPKMDEYYKVN